MKKWVKKILSGRNLTAGFAAVSIVVIIFIFTFIFWEGFQIFTDEPFLFSMDESREIEEELNLGNVPQKVIDDFRDARIALGDPNVEKLSNQQWKLDSETKTYKIKKSENRLKVYQDIKLSDILAKEWYPSTKPYDYGVLPLFAGSLAVTAIALLIAVPIGLFGAMYIAEVASPMVRTVLKPIIEVLAGVPSVIYGFFGFVFIAPKMQNIFDLTKGECLLTAAIILAAMVLPVVMSVSEDAISSIPKKYKDASLALGATKWSTLIKVVIPAAASGISASIILAFGRAIGETIAVALTIGNTAIFPTSIFDGAYPLTAVIANEMGEAGAYTPHGHALFFLGIILFTTTFITNLIARKISTRGVVEE